MRRLAALAALALVLIPSASAGGQQPLGSWAGGGQHSSWIEQQQTGPGEPHNPLDCLWSVNDHESWVSSGYLNPGQSTSFSKCVVSDWGTNSPYGFSTAYVVAKSPAITVTVCFQPQGRCFSSARTFCGRAHYDQSDPALAEIPGSNGGTGLVTTVTTTITNTGSKRVRDITARVGYASDIAVFLGWADALGCLPEFPYVDHFEYPFEWTN